MSGRCGTLSDMSDMSDMSDKSDFIGVPQVQKKNLLRNIRFCNSPLIFSVVEVVLFFVSRLGNHGVET